MAGFEAAHVAGGGPAQAVDSLVVVGGGGELAAPCHEQLDQGQPGEAEVLVVVDEHVGKALDRARGRLLAGFKQADGADQQVAGVHGTRLGEHPLVRAVDLGELALCARVAVAVALALALALGGRGKRVRPVRVGLCIDQLVLEPVDALDEARQQAGGAPAEVVAAKAQL